MLLQSPKHLHYPVTVTELLKKANDNVDRFAPLFSYSYKSTVSEGNKYGDEYKVEKSYAARFESETEGTIVTWKITVGTVIDKAGVDLVEIDEPCKHETQFGGLCVICGRDMTEVDYRTTRPDSDRANINMAHGNTALRVSQAEAARVEQDAKRRLLESKKLSLVVDLDQTIIHATVDPTVAEWMKDPSNPNYQAVKDVECFQLLDDGPGRGCWYYIKLRPGLREFLEHVSQLYELHIYTMGTRAYAMHIAKIVDPERKIFGDRILSRDESGSLTAKSLQRLFPIDTKMVVVIDDRGDVWSWSKNLIKVRPYDFFVGIGDINSSFLPKRDRPATDEELEEALNYIGTMAPKEVKFTPGPKIEQDGSHGSNGGLEHPANGEQSTLDKLVSMGGSNDAAAVKERSDQQDETLAAQLADRPLLQKQKILDEAEEKANEEAKTESTNGESDVDESKGIIHHRHNLLQDDDTELKYLGKALHKVHKLFYDAYRQNMAGSMGGRVAELRQDKPVKKRPDEDMSLVPHVQTILPEMKLKVLGDVVLVFSGVVPLGLDARLSDIGQWAQSFGAKIDLDLTEDTTHVIASKARRTAKVRAAARSSKIKIVTTEWLLGSLSQWKTLDEGPYVIEVEPDAKERPSSQGTSTTVWDEFHEALSSSESEDEADNEDLDGASEDASVSIGENKTKPLLGLQTDLKAKSRKRKSWDSGDEDDVADDEDCSAGSPVDDFEEDDWAAMSAEFDEDDEDDEDDGESQASQSDAAEGIDVSLAGENRRPKRKHDAVHGEGEAMDSNGVDASESLGSDLQMRKRRALRRPSGLSKVATMDSTSDSGGPTSAPASQLDEERAGNPDDGQPDATDDTDDGFDADFEAALEAQLDEEDDSDADGAENARDDDGG